MTTYTNNVPQGNQRIADTQVPIQANFGFLQTAIGTEHNFNTTDPTKTYHLQASMPNQAVNPAIPAGTNGVYYVSGNSPRFKSSLGDGSLLFPNAYIQFNGNGANGPLNAGGNSIRSSFNINAAASTKNGTGDYTITFATPLASANYLVLITGMRGSAGEVFGFVDSDGTYSDNLTTGFVNIGFQSSGGSARNVLMGSVFIFGA